MTAGTSRSSFFAYHHMWSTPFPLRWERRAGGQGSCSRGLKIWFLFWLRVYWHGWSARVSKPTALRPHSITPMDLSQISLSPTP